MVVKASDVSLKCSDQIVARELHVGTGVFKPRPLHVTSYTNTEY